MKILDPFLKIKTENRNTFKIIIWWELRRILYNLIVVISLVISLLIFFALASSQVKLKPGEDLYEPIMIPIFMFLCNAGYSLGWITEIFKKKSSTYGPKMFKLGLYFTLFWSFLPAILWVIISIIGASKKIF